MTQYEVDEYAGIPCPVALFGEFIGTGMRVATASAKAGCPERSLVARLLDGGRRWLSLSSVNGMRLSVVATLALMYSVLVAVGAAHHEPWADEAQAWLLARDTPWLELQWRYLRHEGSPGLWHTLLYLPAQLGLPYEASIATIAAICAIAGVVLFLWLSPLPQWLSALVPFSFFVLYQYAVVARSYCLLLALLALSAHFLRTWSTRPLRLGVVLVLLSHVSAYGTVLSLAFVAQVGLDALRTRQGFRSWAVVPGVASWGLCIANGVLLVLLLQAPPDLAYASARSEGGEAAKIALFYAGHAFGGYFAPTPVLLATLSMALVTLLWAVQRGAIFGMVATLLLAALAGLLYANAWHVGVLFLAWIIALWVAWDRFLEGDPVRRRLTLIAMTLVVSLQVGYGLTTWRMELRETYSGAREAARYLQARWNGRDAIWAYDFVSVAVQPYFDRPIFANHALADGGKAFWLWSVRNMQATLPLPDNTLCQGRPDLVFTVRESRYASKFNAAAFEACGYEVEREFPGVILFQGERLNEMTYVLLRRRRDAAPYPASQ